MSDSESLFGSDDDILSVKSVESDTDGRDLHVEDFEVMDPQMYGHQADEIDTTVEAGAPLLDEVDFLEPVPNWEENALVEAQEKYSSFPEHWSRRNYYLREYASAVRGEKQRKKETMRQLLEYSPTSVDKALDRKLRQTLKTEDMEQVRNYYTQNSNLRDVLTVGTNLISKNVLKHSSVKKKFNDDVIDKILRYIDPEMHLPGVPLDINGAQSNAQDVNGTGLHLAALGSRDLWKRRQYLHPMYREPYRPLLAPDELRPPAELEALEKEYFERQRAEEIARRNVYRYFPYRSSGVIGIINSYL